MHTSRGLALSKAGLIIAVIGVLEACAGGLVGGKERKHAYFDKLEQETLARLTKEEPKAKKELEESVGYLVAEQDVVKIPTIGWATGAGVVLEKATGKRSYLRIPEIQFGMGWGGRVEKIVMIFQDIDKLHDIADGKWYAGASAEAAAKAGDVGAAGSGGTSDLLKKGYTSYVLTDAGISATATVAALRAQPYSID